MQKLFGLIAAIVGVFLLLAVFNSGNNTPLLQWPIEGFQNLVFSIGWLSPFPDWLAIVVAAITILLIIAIFYKLGEWLYTKLARL